MLRNDDFEASIDRDAARRLRTGDISIDARLDLHGLTQDRAHAALMRFLENQIASGSRHLLVVTGKGAGGAGALRTYLAGWIEASPFASAILNIRPAASKHGGNGAFYVFLKRRK